MNKIKTYAIGSAVFVGLFFAGSLMQTRQSQAKGGYSSPVTVFNTTSNPVQGVDVEKLARVPYQSNSTADGFGGTSCIYGFSAAPAGFRLVGEHLSGKLLASTSSVTGGVVGEIDDNTLNATVYFAGPLGETQNTFSQAIVSQPIKMYVDSSHGAPFAVVASRWNIGTLTLTGYLENCSITGCPAIQH